MKPGQQDRHILLIVSALVLQIFLFAPLLVLLRNFSGFPVHFSSVLGLGGLVSLLLILVLWALVRVLRISLLPALMVLISTVVLLEARVFLVLADIPPLQGEPVDWASLQWLSSIELVIIAVLTVLFIWIRKRLKWLSAISLFVLLFNTVSLLLMMVYSTDLVLGKPRPGMSGVQYYEQFYRLSAQRNVMHIVPSQAQGAMLHDVLGANLQRYAKVFDGFTMFSQASGQFPATYPSVLNYMTGVSLEPEYDLTLMQPYTHEQIGEALRQHSIVNVLAREGFDTYGFQFYPQVFCQGRYTACTGSHDEVFAGVPARTAQRRLLRSLSTLFDVVMFQSSPMLLRQRIYNDGLWLFSQLQYLEISHSGVLDLLIDEMVISGNKPTYNYIHHAGAHAPVMFDNECQFIGPQNPSFENQQRQLQCSLQQFERLIRKLKDLNVYDQTMIVIHGDHGTPWLPEDFEARAGSSIRKSQLGLASTLLLIKPPASRGELQFSNQAVMIGDVPATIAAALEIDHRFDGAQVFDERIPTDRERVFFTYEATADVDILQALPDLARFRIRGDLFNEADWQLPNAGFDSDRLSQLRMDHPRFTQFAKGFSHLEIHESPSRWVDGNQASVSLQPPASPSMALILECYVPPSIRGQSITLWVDGIEVGRLDETQLERRRHVIPLPRDLKTGDWIDIRLNMTKTLKEGQDTRDLSVLVSYIGLEPIG